MSDVRVAIWRYAGDTDEAVDMIEAMVDHLTHLETKDEIKVTVEVIPAGKDSSLISMSDEIWILEGEYRQKDGTSISMVEGLFQSINGVKKYVQLLAKDDPIPLHHESQSTLIWSYGSGKYPCFAGTRMNIRE